MVYSLIWLPDVLESAGLKVAETPGWRTRGRAEMGEVLGVMCHHTATSAGGNMPTLNLLINGRSDLQGPLAQLGLGRDGTFYVIAAGRANHAGRGDWRGITTGNSSFIGIEAENSGLPADAWPAVQIDAYQRGVAALLLKVRASASMCCGHKEYALPAGRKADPSFDMGPFRTAVDAYLKGKTPPALIAPIDGAKRPTIRRGDDGTWVEQAQKALGVKVDGSFGGDTEAAVRVFQRSAELVPDGIIGPKSWDTLLNQAGTVAPAPPSKLTLGQDADLPMADTPTNPPRLEDGQALSPSGDRFARRSGSGLQAQGSTSVWTWFSALHRPLTSPEKTIDAVCGNEGYMEAINSYDDAHLSFGIMQWTAGQGEEPGELPGMLARLKRSSPDTFTECFGQYGMDVHVKDDATTGFLSINGKDLVQPAQKDALRGVDWGYRFWRAGHSEVVRAAELLHAASRISRFIDAPTWQRPLRDWITSEVGIALVLDEHVNRPGHVPGTIENALSSLFNEERPDPSTWSTADEKQLIDAYLRARSQTTMTSSEERGTRILKLAADGLLSNERQSFLLA